MAEAYPVGMAAAITGLYLAQPSAAPAEGPAARPLCVLVPHFKDEYWLSVAYGVERAARDHALVPRFHEAGGYRAVQRQIEQIATCETDGAAAILIGVVSSDDPGLLGAIAAARIPVFGFVNETASSALSGFVGVDWRDMGRVLGRYLAERHPGGTPDATAVLVTGPEEAGWTAPLEIGLRDALGSGALRLVAVFHADTGVSEQLSEVEAALELFGDADYLIGSAPAVEAAMGLAATGVVKDMPILIATYSSHSVLRGLSSGRVRAAVFDDPQAQGRTAVAQVANALAGDKTAQADLPAIALLVAPAGEEASSRLSSPDYFPVGE